MLTAALQIGPSHQTTASPLDARFRILSVSYAALVPRALAPPDGMLPTSPTVCVAGPLVVQVKGVYATNTLYFVRHHCVHC